MPGSLFDQWLFEKIWMDGLTDGRMNEWIDGVVVTVMAGRRMRERGEEGRI